MKFGLILILVCFALGIWLLELIQSDAGYVLISLNNWTFETSFWFALSVIVVSILAVYIGWRLVIKKLFLSVVFGGRWFKAQRSQSVERLYREGLLNFLTGDFTRASKQLSSVSRRNELPVVRVIASAQAMAFQGRFDDAIATLREAERKYPEDAVWLLKALIPLLINAGRIDEVDTCISHIKKRVPDDPSIPRFEHLKLSGQGNWQGARRLLADKKHVKSLGRDDLEQTYVLGLQELSNRQDFNFDMLEEFWQEVPKTLRISPNLLLPYANRLLVLGEHRLLEKLIVYTLDKQWLPELLDLYAKLEPQDSVLQLKLAENWTKRHSSDSALLLCLGILSIKNQLWGKARTYFESVNDVSAHPRALYFLGYIAEHLGEPEKSHAYYKQAAELGH